MGRTKKKPEKSGKAGKSKTSKAVSSVREGMGGVSPCYTDPFDPFVDSPEDYRKLVTVKTHVAGDSRKDMFDRRYPAKIMLWVHHFDGYGVIVEGTYEVELARRALKKAGYSIDDVNDWHSWMPTLVSREDSAVGEATGPLTWARGPVRSAVGFYFEMGD